MNVYVHIIRTLFLLLLKKKIKARLSRPPEILVLRWPALYLKSRIQCVVGFIGRPPYKSPQIPAGSESHRLVPGYVVCTCFRRYVNPLRTHPILLIHRERAPWFQFQTVGYISRCVQGIVYLYIRHAVCVHRFYLITHKWTKLFISITHDAYFLMTKQSLKAKTRDIYYCYICLC